ncbi:unnamed protein product [Didymodactylos carnosus]|uniref:Roadblock/LAMTOR2 domain-containing protein n=1 Tax=Didymodactylos carnosus TaxID=1234261 RepID=A0A813QVT3_9BILA|nr:unnamed protein product [Didymodactylos carnosus]CAF0940491.1 unnamed protein product [Didymodactylos carnosus]CAF3555044.1 unnamed protein product [Didymodactylos carnosus]CAF3715688.1 unnamed protein product [Didymodactylos carnosus]
MAFREVEGLLDRILALENVSGYVCMNPTGVPIRTTFDDEYTTKLVTQLHPFLERIKRTANHIGLKSVNELRLKTQKCEFLIRTDKECSFIVVQRQKKTKIETED